VQCLADRLVDDVGRLVEQGPEARRDRGAEVRDVIYDMRVQADRLGEVDLDLVPGRDGPGERCT